MPQASTPANLWWITTPDTTPDREAEMKAASLGAAFLLRIRGASGCKPVCGYAVAEQQAGPRLRQKRPQGLRCLPKGAGQG